MHFSKKLLSTVMLFALLLSVIPSVTAHATEEPEDTIINATDEPESVAEQECIAGLEDTITPHFTDAQRAFFAEFIPLAIAQDVEIGIPWLADVAIAAHESGYGTSWRAQKKHIFHGMELKTTYETAEDGWGAFARLMQEEHYTSVGSLEYADDPEGFLEAIVREGGYNPHPDEYIAKVKDMLAVVEEYRLYIGFPTNSEYLEWGFEY